MLSDIEEALSNPNREKIIREFIRTKKDLEYDYIKKLVINDTSRPDFHLKKLVEADILRRIKKRGFYRLNEVNIQPLRKHFEEIVPKCLIGGLGELTLFTKLLDKFQKTSSILPEKYILITSPEVNKDFKKFDKGKFAKIPTEVHEMDYQSVLRENYLEVHYELEKIIIKYIKKLEPICELTGGTKIVTLALMDLSTKYNLKKFYFSENKILWL